MTQNKQPRQLGTLRISVNGKDKPIRTYYFEQYEEGFSFCVDSELDAYQAAFLYQRQSVRVNYAPQVEKWLIQVNKPLQPISFDPDRQFDHVDEALNLIKLEAHPLCALLAVVKKNVEKDECGFAAELILSYGTM